MRFLASVWITALAAYAQAAPLIEEGFNYPVGTALAANAPWSGGNNLSVGIVSGNLTISNLQPIVPAGNELQIAGSSSSVSAYRNFSATPVAPVPGTAVYLSALLNCTLAPTNRQSIASLMQSGATSAHAPDDPLDLYLSTGSGGYRLSVTSGGSDPATAGINLATNTTHLIVVKYAFGVSNGTASIYIDPVPGSPEPVSPAARTGSGDDGSDSVAANLQVVLLHSPSLTFQGIVNLDALRVGTNWADVTPLTISAALTGPQDQSICSGDPAVFSVTATGLPPFNYQWRTNGIPIANATNDNYLVPAPSATDALNAYDVVVSTLFGLVTSRVASLTISYSAPQISAPPSNQMIVSGISNATFTVGVSGDAPLSFQWRTNGIAILNATNTSYTITNVGPADTANQIDVVVANPCGSTTSTPPATVYFPTLFWPVADAGAGFFSGENVIFTNTSGLAYYSWSSPDPTISVTNWNLEGPMSELPLGTTGTSRYGINLNPSSSPEYYIFALANTGPYTPTEPVACITTPDYVTFDVSITNLPISSDGFIEFPGPPNITQDPAGATVLAGQNATLSVTATGPGLGYQWLLNSNFVGGASASVLTLTNLSALNTGVYEAVVTNAFGSATSSVATLTVVSPPVLSLAPPASGAIQLGGNSITGLTYVVQSATNLLHPVWQSILTNSTGASGVIDFQTNTTTTASQFYRLIFP